MADIKPFKTIDEQIEILASRGLTIEDASFARFVLSRVNYYRLTGYVFHLKATGNEKYLSGLTMEELFNIYSFDVNIRSIIRFAIEEVEVLLKSRIAYCFAKSHGALGYLDEAIFKDKSEHAGFVTRFEQLVRDDRQRPFVLHHIQCYDAKFPMWVACELFTFGVMNKLYKNMKTPDKKNIAREFDLTYDLLENWISTLAYTRNLVAHNMRLYNYSFANKPRVALPGRSFRFATAKVFDIFYILSYLFRDDGLWRINIVRQLAKLIEHFKSSISIELIGFPPNWHALLSHTEQTTPK